MSLLIVPATVNGRVVGMSGLGEGDPCSGDSYDFLACMQQSEPTPIPSAPIIPGTSTLPTSTTGASTAQTLAQISAALSQAAVNAAGAYRATQTPGLIQGTNAIYNPQTGQIIGSGQAASISTISTSMLPIFGVVAVIAFVLILGKGK